MAQAEARWAARSFQEYAVEVRQECFCPGTITQWARVEVRAGQVDRVVLLDNGAEVPAAERGQFPTVEQLFSAIRTVSDHDWVEDVVVQFHADLGFPTYIGFVPRPNILDAGLGIYARNAGQLP